MSVIALDCKVISDGFIPIPTTRSIIDGKSVLDHSTFKGRAERILNLTETMVSYDGYRSCSQCEEHGKRCAFDSKRDATFCIGTISNWTKPVRVYSSYFPMEL